MKNHKQQVAMATEIGRLLPETKEKVEYYRELLKAESDLISVYEKRQSSWFVSELTKKKENLEIFRLKSSINQKKKVFESYLSRKREYEAWMDEMSIEVLDKFDYVKSIAVEIPYASNPRLQDGISKFEMNEETNTIKDKIEMYLFMKNEIINYEKSSKKKLLEN
jgi:hypothetical protein